MKKGMMLSVTVIAVMVVWGASSALAGADYYYLLEMLSQTKVPVNGNGFIVGLSGRTYIAKSNGHGDWVFYLILDEFQSFPYYTQPDALSYSNPIAEWLKQIEGGYSHNGAYPAIHYTVKEKDDLGDFSWNSLIMGIDADQNEAQVIRWENISESMDADQFNGDQNLRDFDALLPGTTPPGTLYLSDTKKSRFNKDDGQLQDVGRQDLNWIGNQGSGPNGSAHEADVLTRFSDGSHAYFVKAWRLAECLLYAAGSRPFEDLGYHWDSNAVNQNLTTGGRVVDSNNNDPVAGYDAINNFIRYVIDVDALVVEDVDGDGEFDAGVDRILFSLVDDALYTRMAQWRTGPATVPTPFAGHYFNGATIFMYDGYNVTTFFDPGTGVFFGDLISTTPATLWAGSYFPYDLDGLDIYLVPEPSAVYLMLGSATALAALAGALRRRASR